MNDIPEEYYGWWRITETGTWVDDGLDDLGPAMISFTGDDDRLRLHSLLAHVNAQGTRSGVSFMWMGAREYDQMSGTGTVKLGQDGRLKGKLRIKNGDDSTFVAEGPTHRRTVTSGAGGDGDGLWPLYSRAAAKRRMRWEP